MGMLNPDLYRTKIRELEAYLKSNVPEEILKARDAALEEAKNAGSDEDAGEGSGGSDANVQRELKEIERAALAAAIADAEAKQESNEDLSEAEIEFLSKLRGLKFASSALSFIEVFENANSSFQTMLMSTNPSDVTEALRFFVKAKHFGLPCAVTGMRRALALMWSNDTNIQEEVLRAFLEVFVAEPGTEGKELLPANQIAQNFLDLAGEATLSELASIEEALGRLVKKEIIPPDVFSILWTMASQADGLLRASAMLIISMAASADPKIVDSAYRLQNLYDAGLGDYTEEHRDWKSARSAACALQRVARAKVDPSSAKYIMLDLITERLVAVARGDWCDDDNEEDTNSWFCAAEQAINAIFAISPAPEKVSMEILLGHQAGIFGSSEEPHSAAHSRRLSRFFFVVGHIALKLLIYTEVLSSAVRRSTAAKSVKKQESASSGKNDKGATAESSEGRGDEVEDDAIEAELGIAAQAEAETERQVAEISEHEIVGRGMISLFTPMLLRVVANEEGIYSSLVLMQSATLALCKCMCISKSFCEKHLPLLFSVLAKAPNDDQDLRANIVIALGDLAFRFPNEVEPYTPKMYACLRDKSTRVRRHTLMVLTHLILNDMVKVKGNVCEIALCLQDQEPRIRDMARLLFHELSKRTNSPIYNLLPDIVSQLSQLSLKQEVFREIMLFLLSFITKDRQNEMLVEKLIQRFPKCTSINQKADLAYCIAQLKVNDKCIKCLNDTFKLYKDALFDEDVLKNFMSVVSKAKKNSKLDTKDTIEELENKLNEHAAAGMENVKASNKALRAKKRAAKRVANKKEWEESDEEKESEPEEEDQLDEENHPVNEAAPQVEEKAAKGKKATRSKKRAAKRVVRKKKREEASDDETESEQEDAGEEADEFEFDEENMPENMAALPVKDKAANGKSSRSSRAQRGRIVQS
jgi:condensin complex subunit 1